MATLERAKLITDLVDTILARKEAPRGIYSCPICHGKLQLDYGIYRRQEQRMLGVRAMCKNCGLDANIDSYHVPTWLKQEA